MPIRYGGGDGEAGNFADSLSGPASAAVAGVGEGHRSEVESKAEGFRQAAQTPHEFAQLYATAMYRKAYIEGLSNYRQQSLNIRGAALDEKSAIDHARAVYWGSRDANSDGEFLYRIANQKDPPTEDEIQRVNTIMGRQAAAAQPGASPEEIAWAHGVNAQMSAQEKAEQTDSGLSRLWDTVKNSPFLKQVSQVAASNGSPPEKSMWNRQPIPAKSVDKVQSQFQNMSPEQIMAFTKNLDGMADQARQTMNTYALSHQPPPGPNGAPQAYINAEDPKNQEIVKRAAANLQLFGDMGKAAQTVYAQKMVERQQTMGDVALQSAGDQHAAGAKPPAAPTAPATPPPSPSPSPMEQKVTPVSSPQEGQQIQQAGQQAMGAYDQTPRLPDNLKPGSQMAAWAAQNLKPGQTFLDQDGNRHVYDQQTAAMVQQHLQQAQQQAQQQQQPPQQTQQAAPVPPVSVPGAGAPGAQGASPTLPAAAVTPQGGGAPGATAPPPASPQGAAQPQGAMPGAGRPPPYTAALAAQTMQSMQAGQQMTPMMMYPPPGTEDEGQ